MSSTTSSPTAPFGPLRSAHAACAKACERRRVAELGAQPAGTALRHRPPGERGRSRRAGQAGRCRRPPGEGGRRRSQLHRHRPHHGPAGVARPLRPRAVVRHGPLPGDRPGRDHPRAAQPRARSPRAGDAEPGRHRLPDGRRRHVDVHPRHGRAPHGPGRPDRGAAAGDGRRLDRELFGRRGARGLPRARGSASERSASCRR